MEFDPQLADLLTDCLADSSTDASRRRAEDRWSELIRRYRPLLRRVIRHTLKLGRVPVRSEDVDELVQETLCRLYENRRGAWLRFRHRGEWTWRAYLTRIARNVAWDRVRTLVRDDRLGVALRVESRSTRGCAAGPARLRPWGPDAPSTPEEQCLAREERRVFWRRALRASAAERRLRRRNAGILYRVWVRGWTSREVSRSLSGELSPSSVDTVVHRARRGLGVGRAGRRYTPRARGAAARRHRRRRPARLG